MFQVLFIDLGKLKNENYSRYKCTDFSNFLVWDSNKIIEKVENKEIILILSGEILKEFAGVLNYHEIQEKIKNKNLEMKYTLQKIIEISQIVEPKERFNVIKEDPSDIVIIW